MNSSLCKSAANLVGALPGASVGIAEGPAASLCLAALLAITAVAGAGFGSGVGPRKNRAKPPRASMSQRWTAWRKPAPRSAGWARLKSASPEPAVCISGQRRTGRSGGAGFKNASWQEKLLVGLPLRPSLRPRLLQLVRDGCGLKQLAACPACNRSTLARRSG